MGIYSLAAVRLNQIDKIGTFPFFYKHPLTPSLILVNRREMPVCWNYFPALSLFSGFMKTTYTATYLLSEAALAQSFLFHSDSLCLL